VVLRELGVVAAVQVDVVEFIDAEFEVD